MGNFLTATVYMHACARAAHGVHWVCCVSFSCCLFDLARFFLPSLSSLIKTFICIYIIVHVAAGVGDTEAEGA